MGDLQPKEEDMTFSERRHPCPCCGYLTFNEPHGSYAICPICYWEDDAYQLYYPDDNGGANQISLVQCQQNFLRIGASEERLLQFVRPPTEEDQRDPTWKPIDLQRDIFGTPHWEGLRDKQIYYWRET